MYFKNKVHHFRVNFKNSIYDNSHILPSYYVIASKPFLPTTVLNPINII